MKIIRALLTFLLLILGLLSVSRWLKQAHTIRIKADKPGSVIPNIPNNLNSWAYQDLFAGLPAGYSDVFHSLPENYYRDTLPAIQYVQVLMAAGGSDERDLFRAPDDLTVTDDYAFEPLVEACGQILSKGLKPLLKLGNVPRKLSDGYEIRDFGVNVRPPNDYNLWRDYIKAMIQALVDAYGLEELRSWRFGSLSEYNNFDWFRAGEIDWDNVDDPAAQKIKEDTAVAVCQLYDYTVDALQQVLGEEVTVGIHNMVWEKNDGYYLLEHCARGTNYATGKTGTRIVYAAVSSYSGAPGRDENNQSCSIEGLRAKAESLGLHLFYGIDEGLILDGRDGSPILSRMSGTTWQAAMLARKLCAGLDSGLEYLSFWAVTSSGSGEGLIPVSTQTANLFTRMAGSRRLPVQFKPSPAQGRETGAIAGISADGKTLYLMVFAYNDNLDAAGELRIPLLVKGLAASGAVEVRRTLVSDESNYYDDFLADMRADGHSDDELRRDSFWSMEDFILKMNWVTPERFKKYEEASQLQTIKQTCSVKQGVLRLQVVLPVHGVALVEVDLFG